MQTSFQTITIFKAMTNFRWKSKKTLLASMCLAASLQICGGFSLPNASVVKNDSMCIGQSSHSSSLWKIVVQKKHKRTHVPAKFQRHSLSPSFNALSMHAGYIDRQLAIMGTKNVISAVASVCVLCGYHLRLVMRERSGDKTWRTVQADIRERWSQYVRKTEGWLYAIQTMRNAITSMTFLSTTVLSLLTVITGRFWEVMRTVDPICKNGQRRILVLQFISIATCMVTSAYSFLQSARLMTHAGFMFPVEKRGSTKVDRVMRKSQNAQWTGLRLLYISMGLISWVIGGSKVFLVSSVLLCLFFEKIDKVPEGLNSDE
mmetsp:Transcript_18460/g.42260  ORF Transcript_18460/g.42260 Transcript_18460/m.42260 type:complete len:317 (-) Transcript_18460:99-1049(-)